MGVALLGLLILNVVSLGLLWRITGPQGGSQAAEFLMHELRFDATQRKAYWELIHQHRDQMRKLEFGEGAGGTFGCLMFDFAPRSRDTLTRGFLIGPTTLSLGKPR